MAPIYLSCSSVNPVTGFRYKLSSSFDPCSLLPLQAQTPVLHLCLCEGGSRTLIRDSVAELQ